MRGPSAESMEGARERVNKVVPIRSLPAFDLEDPSAEISVIMVVYMTGPALFTSIARVLADPDVDDFVIVDNGSSETDQARLFAISQTDDRIRLLQGHGNIGFARGANLGASAARGRFPNAPRCAGDLRVTDLRAPSRPDRACAPRAQRILLHHRQRRA